MLYSIYTLVYEFCPQALLIQPGGPRNTYTFGASLSHSYKMESVVTHYSSPKSVLVKLEFQSARPHTVF